MHYPKISKDWIGAPGTLSKHQSKAANSPKIKTTSYQKLRIVSVCFDVQLAETKSSQHHTMRQTNVQALSAPSGAISLTVVLPLHQGLNHQADLGNERNSCSLRPQQKIWEKKA